MNDQERQIITDIFKRLEQTAQQTREPDADRFIAEKVKTQPYAPYAMAQALYVQEEAMKSLNQQLEQIKGENAQLRQQGGSQGGIFGSLFGGGQRPPPVPQQNMAPQQGYAPQQGGPWGGQPQQQAAPWGGQPQQAPAAGGGFLKSALTTAAGVAGGMVVGNALMNAFSGSHHSTLGSLSNNDMSSMGLGDGLSPSGASSSGYQNANFDDGGSAFADNASSSSPSFSDGGVDFDSGDDSWT